MIPLKDDNPTEHFPYVTLALIVLNTAVFIYQLSLGARGNNMMVLKMGIIPYEFTHALDIPPYSSHPLALNLITAMFMHGGFLHLGGNMLYLWIFGNNIEDSMGPVRFILFYLLTGMLASATHIFLQPDMKMPMIGASGAVSGVLGAYLILFPKAKVLTLIILFFFITVIKIPALILLGFWFVLQFFNMHSHNNIAWFAHVGGFISGIILVRFFVRKGFRSRFSFRK